MRIGDLARRSGVAASRIRFYEERGLLPRAERGRNGYRDYPASTVDSLRLIVDAQALGFSLREIGAGLPAQGSIKGLTEVILPALERKLADVEALIAHSQGLRARLRRFIAVQHDCLQSSEPSEVRAER
jgi:MerR family transcriptional regulator, copper efflux regulator